MMDFHLLLFSMAMHRPRETDDLVSSSQPDKVVNYLVNYVYEELPVLITIFFIGDFCN